MRVSLCQRLLWTAGCLVGLPAVLSAAEPVVPGTGQKIVQVGDDFEDPNWAFHGNLPKSSEEQDERTRMPGGWSSNRRWYEGIKRGHPDMLKRVATPDGGLEGSEASLMMRTLHSGIPGRPSYQMQQDDFVANCDQILGGKIPVSQSPSVVVRIFLPPIDTWENRSGATFGFRASVDTRTWKVPEGGRRPAYVRETYWPGMFIEFESRGNSGRSYDTAYWRIRGDQRGRDFRGPQITQTGWWTAGMSFTSDGQVHYYVKQGIEDLTADDYVTSQYPYGYRAERFKTFFFNVCNRDDGRSWSTPWVIDDPAVYFVPPDSQMARSKGDSRSK
jgi:hypothetical protein